MKNSNNKKKNKTIVKINKNRLIIVLFLLLVVSSVSILLIFKFNSSSKRFSKPVPTKLNFESRIDKLNEFDSGKYFKMGWLQVEGTNIDLPILDHTSGLDEIDYSYGWVSPHYNSDQNRMVLLGHNILNVSNSPMVGNKDLTNFEDLMSLSYYGIAKDNQYIQYTQNGVDELYIIYAIGFRNYGYDNAESFANKKDVKQYIKEAKENSIYDYGVDVNASDELITLKTCTRYFGTEKNQQFMIDARKLRKDEQILKYDVKTTKKFDELDLNDQKM